MSRHQNQQHDGRRKIAILPQVVVERIAAGEVIQRPVAAVKECIENSIDAGATEIIVQIDPKIQTICISDNGCGMDQEDMLLAAVRHATSKIQNVDDLVKIQSYGFRGEALASISMVSRLSIVSRTSNNSVGYKVTYHDGKPTTERPYPTARTKGTTITIQDLFYNIPHRKRMKSSDEYNAILKVLQSYAIHNAHKGISFHCQYKNSSSSNNNTGTSRSSSNSNTNHRTDLNTSNIIRRYNNRSKAANLDTCSTVNNNKEDDNENKNNKTRNDDDDQQQHEITKEVFAQIYGSHLVSHLQRFTFELSRPDVVVPNEEQQQQASSSSNVELQAQQQQLASSYSLPTAAISSTPMESTLYDEEVMMALAASSETPLPPPSISSTEEKGQQQTKSKLVYACSGLLTSPYYSSNQNTNKAIQFTLFINHRLVDGCLSIKRTIENVYNDYTKLKPYVYMSLVVPSEEVDVNVHPTKREVALLYMDDICYDIARQLRLLCQQQSYMTDSSSSSKTKTTNPSIVKNPYLNRDNNKKRKQDLTEEVDEQRDDDRSSALAVKHDYKIPPSKLVRTSRSASAGLLEPYLVPTQSLSQQQQSRDVSASSPSDDTTNDRINMNEKSKQPQQQQQHNSDCPLLVSNPSYDLTIPGAFAKIASLCHCIARYNTATNRNIATTGSAYTTTTTTPPASRPIIKSLSPYPCSYQSIQSLRRRTYKDIDINVRQKLKSSVYVGMISHHRSIIQCHDELVIIDHYELARCMFYQLALNRFQSGDAIIFPSECYIDIKHVVGIMLQVEESIHDSDYRQQLQQHIRNNSIDNIGVKVSETNDDIAQQVTDCLWEKASMLREYFSIIIRKDDMHKNKSRIVLCGLPLLLRGYEPSLHGIPLFLLRLATEVDWSNEKSCFHHICYELGSYYAQISTSSSDGEGNMDDNANNDNRSTFPLFDSTSSSLIQHHIYPAICSLLRPNTEWIRQNSDSIVTVATLTSLYRIFERC